MKVYAVACPPDVLGRTPSIEDVVAGRCPGDYDVLIFIAAVAAIWIVAWLVDVFGNIPDE